MRAVVQRVIRGSVTIDGQMIAQIGRGLVVLLAVERGDAEPQAAWMASRLAGLRIFPGAADGSAPRPFDLDIRQAGGQVLLVSNFTVAASCAKGRRPSLDAAAPPGEAEPVFNRVRDLLAAETLRETLARAVSSLRAESCSSFSATLRSSSGSYAAYTTPMPPAPSSSSTR